MEGSVGVGAEEGLPSCSRLGKKVIAGTQSSIPPVGNMLMKEMLALGEARTKRLFGLYHRD